MPVESLTEVESLFRAVADPTRLRLMHLLYQGEVCVCDLVDALNVSQPTVSRHLRTLKQAGLVQSRKQANWQYYSLAEAESDFQKSLQETLEIGFTKLSELTQDLERLKSTRCP